MRSRRLDSLVILIAAVLVMVNAASVLAIPLTPVVFGSIADSPPDGLGDTIVTFVPGVIDNVTVPPASVSRATSAIVEYDVSALAGAQLSHVLLDGAIFANNSLDTGERMIDILMYSGDGMLSVSDFHVAATSVGVVSYRPPLESHVAFSIDVTDIVQTLVDGGSHFVGVRFAALNFQAPSQLIDTMPPTIVVPEPGSLALLGIGVAALGGVRRRTRVGAPAGAVESHTRRVRHEPGARGNAGRLRAIEGCNHPRRATEHDNSAGRRTECGRPALG